MTIAPPQDDLGDVPSVLLSKTIKRQQIKIITEHMIITVKYTTTKGTYMLFTGWGSVMKNICPQSQTYGLIFLPGVYYRMDFASEMWGTYFQGVFLEGLFSGDLFSDVYGNPRCFPQMLYP